MAMMVVPFVVEDCPLCEDKELHEYDVRVTYDEDKSAKGGTYEHEAIFPCPVTSGTFSYRFPLTIQDGVRIKRVDVSIAVLGI